MTAPAALKNHTRPVNVRRDAITNLKLNPLALSRSGVSADIVVMPSAAHRGCPLAEHAIQLVDEQIHGLVGVLGRDRSHEVGSTDFNMALGSEHPGAATRCAFHIDAKPKNPWFVAKQSFRLRFDGRFGGFVEIEVNSGKN